MTEHLPATPTRITGQFSLWLVRFLFLALILISLSSFLQIPDFVQSGDVRDVVWTLQADGQTAVTHVLLTGAEKGVMVADVVINPQDALGALGSEVIIYFRTGQDAERPVKFTRQPTENVVYGLVSQGYSLQSSYAYFLIFLLGQSLVFALVSGLIFWRRSDDWLALMIAWLFMPVMPPVWPLFRFYSVIYTPIVASLLAFVVLVFPTGQLKPRWTLVLPVSVFVIQLYTSLVSVNWLPINQELYSMAGPALNGVMVVCLVVILYRYRHVFMPDERQQAKWVLLGFAITPLISLLGLPLNGWMSTGQPDAALAYGVVYFAVGQVLMVLVPLGFVFAMLRYKLWDVDVVINRALVYGVLTSVLGLLGVSCAAFLNYTLKQLFSSENPALVAIITALPLTAAFKPVEEWLQKQVDRLLKPQDLDIHSVFLELSPDVHFTLPASELCRALIRESKAHLCISAADVYWRADAQNPELIQWIEGQATPLSLELNEDQCRRLEKGQVVEQFDDDGIAGLLIPLIVTRGNRLDFHGVLALGPRLDGLGYSSTLCAGLQRLGAEAGKAIYLAKLRDLK